MLRKKILAVMFLCAGLFLFSNSESHSVEGTVVGYPQIQNEGRLEYATLVLSPNNAKGVLFIGELSETNESFRQCFQKGLDRGLEVVITGNIVPYDSPYYKEKLVFDNTSRCSTR